MVIGQYVSTTKSRVVVAKYVIRAILKPEGRIHRRLRTALRPQKMGYLICGTKFHHALYKQVGQH